MTDTIEAVALQKLRADLDEATKQHMPAMVVTTDYLRSVLDTLASLRAEVERLTRAAALSDLIAGDAHLIDTVADSDGDDGA